MSLPGPGTLHPFDAPPASSEVDPPILQEGDPGAVGAGREWLIPSTGVGKVRNAANTGWITRSAGSAVEPSDTVTGPDDYGDAADPGEATEYSRGDHDHGLPDAPVPTSPLQGAAGTGSATGGAVAFADAAGSVGGLGSLQGGHNAGGTARQGGVFAGGTHADGTQGGVYANAGDKGIAIDIGYNGDDLIITGTNGATITLSNGGNITVHAGDGHTITLNGRDGFAVTTDQGGFAIDGNGDVQLSTGPTADATLSISIGDAPLVGEKGQALGSDGLTHVTWQDLTSVGVGTPTGFVTPFVYVVGDGLYAWIGGNAGAYQQVA